MRVFPNHFSQFSAPLRNGMPRTMQRGQMARPSMFSTIAGGFGRGLFGLGGPGGMGSNLRRQGFNVLGMFAGPFGPLLQMANMGMDLKNANGRRDDIMRQILGNNSRYQNQMRPYPPPHFAQADPNVFCSRKGHTNEQFLHGPDSGFDSDFVPPRPAPGKTEMHLGRGGEVWKMTRGEASAEWQHPDNPLIKCKVQHDYETGERMHTVEYHTQDAKGNLRFIGRRSETNYHDMHGSAPGKKGCMIATWHLREGWKISQHDGKGGVVFLDPHAQLPPYSP